LKKIPPPTENEAKRFAKLFHSGTPAVAVMLQMYDFNDHDMQDACDMADSWLCHPQILNELLELDGGNLYEDLSIPEQATRSVAKSHRERAWYLWTHHFAEVDGSEKARYKDAYESLTKWYPPTGEGAGDPVEQFWKSFGPELKKKIRDLNPDDEKEH
jgi:hypothetical protein